MRMMLIGVIVLLTGCATGPTADRRISAGQWTIPQSVGNDTYLVEGFDTQDALNGAKSQCSNMGRQFTMIQLTPHTSRTRATVTFRCN